MEEVIKESDLIQLDGTIDKLIKQLTELNAAYGSTVEAMKLGAENIVRSLKSASGATIEGRNAIDSAAVAVNRYERAMYELEFSMSETGKQVAWLKKQTREINRATVDQKKQLEAVTGSYDKIKSEVKELTALYKSLSEAERNEASFGQEIVAELQAKNAQLKELEKAIKPVVEQMTRLQKAEQELAYWQSEEGQKLLEVKKQIREITSARKEEKATVDPLAAAQEKLAKARSDENEQLKVLALQTEQANTEAQLKAKLAIAEKGSYNELAATYDLVKFKMKGLNVTTAEGAAELERLQEQAKQMYAEMRRFQEATGVYTLGVGDYASSWGGLGFSVQQVVRELPAATVSLNTFFLAISNNIPILVDEINRAKLANKQMLAEGKQTVPVSKQIVKALLSWQSALVIVLTVLSMHGKEILQWASKIFKGRDAAREFSRALKSISKEMKDTNADYGENMVNIRRLTDEYRNLATEADKVKWIEDNKDAWKELNIAIYDVADAEDIFVNNTDKVKEALIERARSAAAYKLAEETFEKQLDVEQKLINAEIEGPNVKDKLRAGQIVRERSGGYAGIYSDADLQQAYEERLQSYRDESDELQNQIDLYYKLGKAAEDAATAKIGEYDDGTGKSKGGRDVTRYIEGMRVKAVKESEEAITRLQISEFAKRRKEALATYNEEKGQLQNTYNENKRILDGYYKLRKPLTEQQRKDLENSNAQILKTLESYELVYKKSLSDIAKDEKIAIAKRQQELIQIKLDAIVKGSDEEYKLRKQAIEKQRELDKLENSKLIKSEQQDEGAIDAKYNKQLEDLEAEKTINGLKTVQNRISLQLEAVKEGSKAEYELRKSAIKAHMGMEIAENSRLATEEQMTEEAIRAKYNKQLEDLEYEHQKVMFDIALEGIELRLGIAMRGSKQELDLVLQQIEQERLAAIAANKQLAKDLQQSEDEINAYYAKRASYAQGNYDLSSFRAEQTTARIGIISKPTIKYGDEGSRKRELFNIGQDLLDINKQIELAEAGKLELSEEQLADLKLQRVELQKQKKELSGFRGVISDIADGGITGGILEALGFDNDAIDAFQQAVDVVLDNLGEILAAETELAEAAVEAAEERVEAAQSAYNAEIEARNNGYANNVETARKELEEERSNQAEKERILAEAQKRQEQLNTVIQTSSLITAAAQLWSTMSAIPYIGPALAIAAIATMFGSFIAAKAKANQMASQAYGEGGLEFLEGGSHASGNDIDLGINNSKNRRMRVEGGEAVAVINRRNTRRYKDILPSVIESFNDGTFQDKYANAFSIPEEQRISINQGNYIDLSTLEDDVRKIRKNNETRYYTTPDGTVIMQYKNLKRIIKN